MPAAKNVIRLHKDSDGSNVHIYLNRDTSNKIHLVDETGSTEYGMIQLL